MMRCTCGEIMLYNMDSETYECELCGVQAEEVIA